MVRVSSVADEDIFKTCLEFWAHFTKDLYNAEVQWKTAGGAQPAVGGMLPSAAASGSISNGRAKHLIFEGVLHNLRLLMIDHMAKPEEVIIVEDDNGEIVREQTKDTEVIAQYKTMRETIVYLTNLNYEDTEGIMLEKLDLQVAGGRFSWNGLNTLCWAIGSISGAMGELDEKRFLVSVIKDLLRLCEEQRGKDNKAVVASNIMYIVGQYPRFLRAHWKFLKTVVNKLFEFMHEHHPGVQDMACDTFLKIAQKCKRKFVTPQVEDSQPFILTLIADLQRHVADLQPHQVQSFYESVGTMLSDQGQAVRITREEVTDRQTDLSISSESSLL
jgi:exportin-1